MGDGKHRGDAHLGSIHPDGGRGTKPQKVIIPKEKDQGHGKTWRGEGEKRGKGEKK